MAGHRNTAVNGASPPAALSRKGDMAQVGEHGLGTPGFASQGRYQLCDLRQTSYKGTRGASQRPSGRDVLKTNQCGGMRPLYETVPCSVSHWTEMGGSEESVTTWPVALSVFLLPPPRSPTRSLPATRRGVAVTELDPQLGPGFPIRQLCDAVGHATSLSLSSFFFKISQAELVTHVQCCSGRRKRHTS